MSTDLLALTAELMAVPSVSHHEAALADRVEAELRGVPGLDVHRVEDNVVARTTGDRPGRLVLAGHLDTVPPAGNTEPRLEGDTLWGLGSSDMKGGLAVMLDLARTGAPSAVEVSYCFYACEEVGREDNGLVQLWAETPELLSGDAAVLGEPTCGLVEAGCQGTLRAEVRLAGVRAHTARPFTGRNAIHRLAPVLAAVSGWEGRTATLDGCDFVEQLQAVAVGGGVAGNVVPDAASLTLNYRFAPDRSGAEAAAFVDRLVRPHLDQGDELVVLDAAEGAPPGLEHPLLADLVAATGQPPRAKVGWTDVASFWAHGVPAANFGPGDPLLAHHPDERLEGEALRRTHRVLGALLAGATTG